MPNSHLPTRNEAWGFYGSTAGFTDADAAWSIAFPSVAKATGATAEGVVVHLPMSAQAVLAQIVHLHV
ncbi:MAG: hypothetical protein N2423_09070 [Novosphingobium sp.]|nr:hypothetical protein [Novosphingobium sp.]